jgi:hypothetical protein
MATLLEKFASSLEKLPDRGYQGVAGGKPMNCKSMRSAAS